MQVADIMTRDPACCTSDTNIQEVARMMAEQDCGEIPVLDERNRPVGVVTDRDIACRAVAQGKNPGQTSAGDVMSRPAITVKPGDSLADCREKMEHHQIRRVPVVDDSGACCGMIAQADIARSASEQDIAELVRDVSQPTREGPRIS